jgi:putative toxin-antitoxin system antitoxin component (TIGR02293 family)
MSDSQAVVKILGVENIFDKPLRQDKPAQTLATIVRAGLPSTSVDRIAQYYGLSKKKISELLGISVRTLERHQKKLKPLNPVQSDRILRYARIAAHAEETFEDAETARNWLKRPNQALGGEIPLDLLDTEAGVQQVDDVLTRIEYGIYS